MTTYPGTNGGYVAHWSSDDNSGVHFCIQPGHDSNPAYFLPLAAAPADSVSLAMIEVQPNLGPGEHVLIQLHISAAQMQYSHDACVVVSMCAGCDEEFIDALVDHGHGLIALHLDDPATGQPAQMGNATFVLGNLDDLHDTIENAKALLVRP